MRLNFFNVLDINSLIASHKYCANLHFHWKYMRVNEPVTEFAPALGSNIKAIYVTKEFVPHNTWK